MAASQVIPNCVEVRLLWIYAGQGAVNVLHAVAPAAFTVNQTAANTLGTAIKSQFTTTLGPNANPGTQLVRVGLRDKRVAGSTEFLDQGAAVSGTAPAGDALPPQTALCITLRTAQSGKSFRGRVYVGGFGEDANAAQGVCSTGAQTGAVNWITGIGTAMTASGLTLAVATKAAEEQITTRTTNHTDGTTTSEVISHVRAKPASVTAVTTIQSRGAGWETQRRRNNGRGSLPTTFNSGFEAQLT